MSGFRYHFSQIVSTTTPCTFARANLLLLVFFLSLSQFYSIQLNTRTGPRRNVHKFHTRHLRYTTFDHCLHRLHKTRSNCLSVLNTTVERARVRAESLCDPRSKRVPFDNRTVGESILSRKRKDGRRASSAMSASVRPARPEDGFSGRRAKSSRE